MKQKADICSLALSLTPSFTRKVRVTDAIARIAASIGRTCGTCSLGEGTVIRVNLRDRIERQMWGGCYEPHVQQALRVLLSPGDVFVDIGGHIGYHSVLGASLVGPSGRVFAFEADLGNFARLREHLDPFPWATAVNKAVWSSSGTVVFERSSEPGESGWGTLTTVRDLKRGDHLAVDTISIDDWLSESKIVTVSAMKVDAEGSEVNIFRGATQLLRRVRPAVIFESNDVVLQQANTSALELMGIFYDHDYRLFEVVGTTVAPLGRGQPPQCSELLGIPSERAHLTVTRFQRAGFRLHRSKTNADVMA